MLTQVGDERRRQVLEAQETLHALDRTLAQRRAQLVDAQAALLAVNMQLEQGRGGGGEGGVVVWWCGEHMSHVVVVKWCIGSGVL